MRRALTQAHEDEMLVDQVARDPKFPRRDGVPVLFAKGCFETCAVCLEEMTDTVALFRCGHGICGSCDVRCSILDAENGGPRVCVVCKRQTSRDEVVTYPLTGSLRRRHAEFERDLHALRDGTAGAVRVFDFAPDTGNRGRDACVLALDVSGSMASDDGWYAFVKAVPDLIKHMVGSYLAVVVFSDVVRVIVEPCLVGDGTDGSNGSDGANGSSGSDDPDRPEAQRVPTRSFDEIASVIEEVRATGGTRIDLALRKAAEVVEQMRSLVAVASAGSDGAEGTKSDGAEGKEYDGTEYDGAVGTEYECKEASSPEVRVCIVTDGDTLYPAAASAEMAALMRTTLVTAVGFGSHYNYDLFYDLCSEVKGRGDSSTLFEHAAEVGKLVSLLKEPGAVRSVRVPCSGARVFFNGQTSQPGDFFVAKFNAAHGARVVVVGGHDDSSAEGAEGHSSAEGAEGRAGSEGHSSAVEFAMATLATEYVMSLSVRIPTHDVHTHTGLLGRTRAALLDVGIFSFGMNTVIGLIDKNVASLGTRSNESNAMARAASSTVRALTCPI
jgi:hypothetical protein